MKNISMRKAFCLGLLWLITAGLQAETAQYAYDDAGRLVGVYYSSGKSITYVYDGAGNLLREVRSSFVDSDGDGMDDAWEITHFGNLSRDGSGDSDNDGQTDLQEFMAGTDPNNNQSLLAITQLTTTPGVGFSIQWLSVPGKYYRVQYNDTLSPAGWKNLGADVLANGSSTSVTDSTVPQSAQRFYRVIALF